MISPTVLVTLLRRASLSEAFMPAGALIYHVAGRFALLCDGQDIRLGQPDDTGRWQECLLSVRPEALAVSWWNQGDTLVLPRRQAYPQHNAHELFPEFVWKRGQPVEQVPSGGAGYQALQFLRSFLELPQPEQCQAFNQLAPINCLLNCQPDWKLWDSSPLQVFCRALNLPMVCSIYGNRLAANALSSTPGGMWHKHGCLATINGTQANVLDQAVRAFEHEYGDGSLLSTNY
jgi:hypothetical protein